MERVVFPQVEFLDKVVGRPRVAQRQALMVQTVRAVPVHTALKTMEDQQLQFFGELVEVPHVQFTEVVVMISSSS